MRPVVGQEKLVKILDSYTLQNVPRTMLFLGPDGCGKNWLSYYLAERLDLEIVNISKEDVNLEDGSADKLIEYYQCPITKMYTINLKYFDEKRQHKLLKFIEEPSENMYIILRAESEIGILDTILNRCVKHYFEPYTAEQLKEFEWAMTCDDSIAYQICKTPGQLLEFSADNLNELFDYCDKIIKSIRSASYANVIAINTKIGYRDEPNKFNFNTFFDVLTYMAFTHYKATKDELSYKIYLYTVRRKAQALNKVIGEENFMLNYLDGLWRLVH